MEGVEGHLLAGAGVACLARAVRCVDSSHWQLGDYGLAPGTHSGLCARVACRGGPGGVPPSCWRCCCSGS